MNSLFVPARAGIVVFACLVAACSGATETEGDGSSGRTPAIGTVVGTTPAPSSPPSSSTPAPTTPTGNGASEPTTPSSAPSGGGGGTGASSGTAICGPDELCHGISTCSNSCYGPNCCSASCQCADIYKDGARLICSLTCSK
jgi:hypothetical protein